MSNSALAHILQGEANLISSLLEIGVFPYPIAIADPSVQNAISPKSTTAFASLSLAIDKFILKINKCCKNTSLLKSFEITNF